MAARCFRTIDEMAEYQVDRELEQALRVQAMSSDERYQWLADHWGRLQDDANVLFAGTLSTQATARCYATPEEKNRFDDAREIEMALQHQRHWQS